MRKILLVVILLQLAYSAQAETLVQAVDAIEKEWAQVYYKNLPNPSAKYAHLLTKANALAKTYPTKAEPLLWQAVLIATDADHQPPMKALEQINQARELLNQAIEMAPTGMNGAALVALGTLYYLTPPWPIAFGDTEKAQELLSKALKISPESIDANYFYGDFLLAQNETEQAAEYFKKALAVPSRKNQTFADDNLKLQAKLALENASNRKLTNVKDNFLSIFNSTSVH